MEERKPRLVYVLHDIRLGGVEVALLSAVPALYERFSLTVVVLGEVDDELMAHLPGEVRQAFKVLGIPTWAYPFKVSGVARYVVSLKPDILVSSLWRASWVGANVKRGMAGVRFFPFVHATKYFHRADAYFTRRALLRADCVLVDSASTSAFVKKSNPGITCIRTVSFLTHPTPQANPSRGKAVTLGSRPVRFLFMGTISKVKAIPRVIDFIVSLRKAGIPAILDLYGREGGAIRDVRNCIQSHQLEEYISYKGPVHPEKRTGIFLEYDFYIQFSESEGMAMSVAEAMQNGLVCIVTPVGEIPSYAKDGASALFVDSDLSMKHAVQSIVNMVGDPVLYAGFSDKSHDSFVGRPTYGESLISCLLQ